MVLYLSENVTRTALILLSLLLLQCAVWPQSSSGDGSPIPKVHRTVQAVEWDYVTEHELAVSSQGIPHLVYIRLDGIVHAELGSGSWNKEIIWDATGEGINLFNIEMALLGEDPIVAFTYSSETLLVSYLSVRKDGEWLTTTLSQDSSVIGVSTRTGAIELIVVNSTCAQLWTQVGYRWEKEDMMVYSEDEYPFCISSGFPVSGPPHLAYFDPWCKLRYVEKVGSLWTDTLVDTQLAGKSSDLDIDVADDAPLILFHDLRRGRTYMAQRIDGEWASDLFGKGYLIVSKPVTGPDGDPCFLQYDYERGMNLTRWRDGVIDSHRIWSDVYIGSSVPNLNRFELRDMELAFSESGTPSVTYLNQSYSQSLEYVTWTSDDPEPNSPPKVRITADVLTGKAPLHVTLTLNATDDDGNVISYIMDFYQHSGGTYRIGEVIEEPGNYTAYAIAFDDDLAYGFTTLTIRVLPHNLTVRILGEDTGEAPFEAEYRAEVAGAEGNITRVEWTPLFDGNFTRIDNYTYKVRFNEPGRHVLFVTVKDTHGSEASAYVMVQVSSQEPDSEPLGKVLVTILGLLLVPVLFSLVAILSMGIVQGGRGERRMSGPATGRGR